MQTKVVETSKLEFVQLPPNAVRHCYAPQPPLDGGLLRYEALPEYALFLLAVIEQCNVQLAQVRNIEQESTGVMGGEGKKEAGANK